MACDAVPYRYRRRRRVRGDRQVLDPFLREHRRARDVQLQVSPQGTLRDPTTDPSDARYDEGDQEFDLANSQAVKAYHDFAISGLLH